MTWRGALAALAVLPTAAAADPLNDYRIHCMGCHLPDGAGMVGKVPALNGSVDAFLRRKHGRAYLARVPGAAQAQLSDADLAALLNWMVQRFGAQGRPPSPPYTAGEVGQLRRRPLQDPQAQRAQILAGPLARAPARREPPAPAP